MASSDDRMPARSGSTIFQKLHEANVLKSSDSARNFGETLVFLGIAMLVVGIGYHVAFMITGWGPLG